MIEVFIPYSLEETSVHALGKTLEAWDTDEYEPVALEVKDPENERFVRIAAEAIAKADYFIVKVGSSPDECEVKHYKKGQGIRVEACEPRIQ